jgi:serine/threonine protein kinase
MDFGFSRQVYGKMTTGVGSEFYRAPEIIYKKAYSEMADLWSLGVVFAEMIRRRDFK